MGTPPRFWQPWTSLPRLLNGGTSIAPGDVDGDGHGEVALGNVFIEEDDHTGSPGGTVVVIRGSAGGPVNGDAPMAELTQDSSGVPGADEANDGFGSAVCIADVNVNGDGCGEPAIGVVFEDLDTAQDAGAAIATNGLPPAASRTATPHRRRTFAPNLRRPRRGRGDGLLRLRSPAAGRPRRRRRGLHRDRRLRDEGIGAIATLTGSPRARRRHAPAPSARATPASRALTGQSGRGRLADARTPVAWRASVVAGGIGGAPPPPGVHDRSGRAPADGTAQGQRVLTASPRTTEFRSSRPRSARSDHSPRPQRDPMAVPERRTATHLAPRAEAQAAGTVNDLFTA